MPTATVSISASFKARTATSPVLTPLLPVPMMLALTVVAMRLTAAAAPTAAVPLPAKLPARDWIMAVSVAWMVSEPVLEPARTLLFQFALIVSSRILVVLEPVTAAVPATPAATASASMVESELAMTRTAPVTINGLLVTSASTSFWAA